MKNLYTERQSLPNIFMKYIYIAKSKLHIAHNILVVKILILLYGYLLSAIVKSNLQSTTY